jgi:hypothetical protein
MRFTVCVLLLLLCRPCVLRPPFGTLQASIRPRTTYGQVSLGCSSADTAGACMSVL